MILLPWSLDGTSDEDKSETHRAAVAVSFSTLDSSATVGLGVDMRTCAALGVHPAVIATSISAQNTRSILGALPVPAEAIQRQFEAICDDMPPQALKSGRVLGAPSISLIAELVQAQHHNARERGVESPPFVVDPVLFSHNGEELQGKAARIAYMRELLPCADIATPNSFEAEVLSGRRVGDIASMKEAAKVLFDLGVGHCVVTSHPDMRHCVDIVYDGDGFVEFGADRVSSGATQGIGCLFSSALTALLARGDDVFSAVEQAKALCSKALAQPLRVGKGKAPVHPLGGLYKKAGVLFHILDNSSSNEPAKES